MWGNSSGPGNFAFLYSAGDEGSWHAGKPYSIALGINDAGQVVGWSYTEGAVCCSPFLYTGEQMYDLNTLIPADSGWVLEEATAINTSGQIVGTGTNKRAN